MSVYKRLQLASIHSAQSKPGGQGTEFDSLLDNRAGGAEGEQDAEAVLSAGATEDHQERAGTGGEETMFFWCAQTSNSCSSFFHTRKMTRMPLRRSSESV